MEKLDLNSELLHPVKQQLEIIMNKLMNICTTSNKEAEITLKINLESNKRYEFEDGKKTKEWYEPKIDYQISEKIKEVKNTCKGTVGEDYELKLNETDNNVYIQKINEQLEIGG